jgi:hypothetical protein
MMSEVKGNVANVVVSSELPSGGPTYSSAGDGINCLFWDDLNDNALTQGTIQYDSGVPGGYRCDVAGNPPPHGCIGYTSTNGYMGRHTSGSIYFLSDGHAKYFKPGSISAGVSASSGANGQVNGTPTYAAGTANLGGFAVTYSIN